MLNQPQSGTEEVAHHIIRATRYQNVPVPFPLPPKTAPSKITGPASAPSALRHRETTQDGDKPREVASGPETIRNVLIRTTSTQATPPVSRQPCR